MATDSPRRRPRTSRPPAVQSCSGDLEVRRHLVDVPRSRPAPRPGPRSALRRGGFHRPSQPPDLGPTPTQRAQPSSSCRRSDAQGNGTQTSRPRGSGSALGQLTAPTTAPGWLCESGFVMICDVVAGELRSYAELMEGRVALPRSIGAVMADLTSSALILPARAAVPPQPEDASAAGRTRSRPGPAARGRHQRLEG